MLGVTEEDAVKSRKMDDPVSFNTTAHLEEEGGGGLVATLEIFHQLHCLVCSILRTDHIENEP